MKDLLLEIGTEEIPARFLEPALSAFRATGQDRLSKAGFTFKDVHVYGTPRRLTFFVEGLSAKAADQEQEFLGPALAQAKDAEGHWTPAAQGFARSQGTTPEKLGSRETERGPRLVFLKKTLGAPTEKILPSLLPDLIRSIPFPKSMVWEESRLAFARPIRWIVALYGLKTVAFTLAGVKAGRRTWGLRFHSRRPFDIPAPHRYAPLLKNHCVIVDPAERRALIVKQIDHVAKTHHGYIPMERCADLLEEVSHLVEHPVAVVGKFDPRFLAVPQEVLVTSMKKHQKYFPVFKEASCGELLPCFVAVRNGLSDNQAIVREGYERVLTARLSDAAFFFSEHAKRPLASRVPDLNGIAFLSPTLHMGDKTDRVCRLTEHVCDLAKETPAVGQEAARIALLGKADLTTGLVGEFPELQGVVGRLYAERDGESPIVSRGIEEHYWPLTAEGPLPTSAAATIVSLADKMDTLAGNFLSGKIPSGSQDPYGLRRAAVGILRILESRGTAFSLSTLVRQSMMLLQPAHLGDPEKAGKSLMDFFQQRWSALAEGRGFRPDEIEAVAASGFDDVGEAWARLSALRDIRRHPDFGPLSVAFKRAANLLKQAEKKGEAPQGGAQEELFRTDAERHLAAQIRERAVFAEPLLANREYSTLLSGLVSLRRVVDDFFVAVVVMDPDMALRQNRLRLLSAVRDLFNRVADFSRLQDTPSASSRE
jgi:glycyl-tRNA synthetase beta chain